jgi:hypothetical protein
VCSGCTLWTVAGTVLGTVLRDKLSCHVTGGFTSAKSTLRCPCTLALFHDFGTSYTWYTAFTTKIATLNSGNFAGHSDWRLPNVNELQSIANYGTFHPAVDAVFNTSCAASCTVTTCSCTYLGPYWSSTTYQGSANYAWVVDFSDGYVGGIFKGSSPWVRAVRGGL